MEEPPTILSLTSLTAPSVWRTLYCGGVGFCGFLITVVHSYRLRQGGREFTFNLIFFLLVKSLRAAIVRLRAVTAFCRNAGLGRFFEIKS